MYNSQQNRSRSMAFSIAPDLKCDVNEMRCLSCRFCIQEAIPEAQSFASKLLGVVDMCDTIELLENAAEVLDDVTTFCEKCRRSTIITFAYYKRKYSLFSHLTLPYNTPESYYCSLVQTGRQKYGIF